MPRTSWAAASRAACFAADLARSLPAATITVADVRARRCRWRRRTCAGSRPISPRRRPSRASCTTTTWASARCRRASATARCRPRSTRSGRWSTCRSRPRIPLTLDTAAARAGIAIVPDCGLAPGLSHLLVGDATGRHGTPVELEILVGGVAQDRLRPYGYVVTWSIDDLLEEYTRPARSGPRRRARPRTGARPHRGLRRARRRRDEGVRLDGLRTLLSTGSGVRTMAEKTLRWPGHVAAIRPLLAAGNPGRDVSRRECVVDPPEDLVALVRRGSSGRAAARSSA